MNKYNFDSIIDRKNTDSYSHQNPKTEIAMWVADMDFRVLDDITNAIKNRADLAAYGYVGVTNKYFESYVNWFKRQHDLTIAKEECLFANGVISALDSIFRNIFSKGDKVMIQTPIYHVFFNCIKNNGLELITNELKYDGKSYEIDWLDFENKIVKEKVKVFLLCNPHNPTGLGYSQDEIDKILEICRRNHVYVISDEIHCDIYQEGYKYCSILHSKKEYQDQTICLFSPSKAFNIASLKSAMVVVPNPSLREKIQDGLWKDDVGEPNYFACDATIAAYEKGDEWNFEMRQYVQRNKDYVKDFVSKHLPELTLVNSNFLYLIWIDISKLSTDSLTFTDAFLDECNIQVSPGAQFKGNGDKFIRVNLATSFANVETFCNRLLKFIDKHYR